MEDKSSDEWAMLMAQCLVLRDVLTHLLAIEATRWPDKEKLFQHFSQNVERHIHSIQAGRDPTSGTLAVQTEMLKQIDWILATARKMTAE